MKILMAEDEQTIAMVFQMMLENSKHKVTLTHDGEECLNAYKAAMAIMPDKSEEYLSKHPPFDVVLLDNRMPKMDGLEAAKHILAINRNQRIIFVTAYPQSSIQDTMKAYAPNEFQILAKPVEMEQLLGAIEKS